MKCKYCDYDNQRDAISCECCGATLATQKPLSYYKRQARKKIRTKNASSARAVGKTYKKRKKDEPSPRIERKRFSPAAGVAVSAICLILCIATVISCVILKREELKLPLIESEKTDRVFSVYDPASNKSFFLLGGRAVGDGSSVDGCAAVSLASGDKWGVFYNSQSGELIYASESGAEVIRLEGYQRNDEAIPAASCSLTEDGRYLVIFLSDKSPAGMQSKIYTDSMIIPSEKQSLFVYKIGSGDQAKRIGDYEDALLLGSLGSRVFFHSRMNGGALYVYNCENRLGSILGHPTIPSSIASVGVFSDMFLFRMDGALYAYRADVDEYFMVMNTLTSISVSPNKKMLAFSTFVAGESSSYVFKDGEAVHVADDFTVFSVSDDGDVLYGRSSMASSILSAGLGKSKKLLSEDAYTYILSDDRTDIIILSDSEMSFSINGEKPSHKADRMPGFRIISDGDGDFVNAVMLGYGYTDRLSAYLYRVNEAYELEIIDFGRISASYAYGQETVLYTKNSLTYKYDPNKSKSPVCVGCVPIGSDTMTSENRMGAYACSDGENGEGLLIYTSVCGDVTIISDSVYGEVKMLDVALLFLETKTEKTLKENTTSADNGENEYTAEPVREDKDPQTYTLKLSRNGKKSKTLLENVSFFLATDKAVYAFVQSDMSIDGEAPLYNVYGGESADNITLLLSNVEYLGAET